MTPKLTDMDINSEISRSDSSVGRGAVAPVTLGKSESKEESMKETGCNAVVFAVACMTLTLLFEIECLECQSIGIQDGTLFR